MFHCVSVPRPEQITNKTINFMTKSQKISLICSSLLFLFVCFTNVPPVRRKKKIQRNANKPGHRLLLIMVTLKGKTLLVGISL